MKNKFKEVNDVIVDDEEAKLEVQERSEEAKLELEEIGLLLDYFPFNGNLQSPIMRPAMLLSQCSQSMPFHSIKLQLFHEAPHLDM